MTHTQLALALRLQTCFLSIRRIHVEKDASAYEKGCALKALKRAFRGETLYFSPETMTCRGAKTGFGFSDGIPDTPGGFGYFISSGKGEGFPAGERIKCSPELGEQMLLCQPQEVMRDFRSICVKPYAETDEADLVTVLASMDQLAALIHIFNFRRRDYDTVIAPMSSGCASVFRIPFGELYRENSRAVIGNMDLFSRPHFDANTAFFTVSAKDFLGMLQDADESVLKAPIWKGILQRL